MIFSYFKDYFIFFNVNEHLAVPFVELARSGSHVSHLRFFCLHRITCLGIHSYSHTNLILLIVLNLPCYLHFALYLFLWLMKLKCIPHPSHHYDCFREPNIVLIIWTPLIYMGLGFLKNHRKGNASVHYFLSNFNFSSNDSPSKTMKNVFYFI